MRIVPDWELTIRVHGTHAECMQSAVVRVTFYQGTHIHDLK